MANLCLQSMTLFTFLAQSNLGLLRFYLNAYQPSGRLRDKAQTHKQENAGHKSFKSKPNTHSLSQVLYMLFLSFFFYIKNFHSFVIEFNYIVKHLIKIENLPVRASVLHVMIVPVKNATDDPITIMSCRTSTRTGRELRY